MWPPSLRLFFIAFLNNQLMIYKTGEGVIATKKIEEIEVEEKFVQILKI